MRVIIADFEKKAEIATITPFLAIHLISCSIKKTSATDQQRDIMNNAWIRQMKMRHIHQIVFVSALRHQQV